MDARARVNTAKTSGRAAAGTAPIRPQSTTADPRGLGVSFDGIVKRFGETCVLDDITFEAHPGDFISLIGPSGCGKTTLLKIVAGLHTPSAGEIRFTGRDTDGSGDTAYVFQDANLLPWLTAVRNVALPLKLKGGIDQTERERRAREALTLVGLAHAADRYPWQLSGGMRMRASIARALTLNPRLLLLDEPFGALDEMTRDKLNEELLKIRERDPWTAFFVTHSVSEAVFLSSRIVVLAPNPGRISAVVDVPMPYPRTSAVRRSDAFQAALVEATTELQKVAEEPSGSKS